jgi:transposase
MRSTVAQSVGVDISKDALDVAIHPSGESFRITNNPEGHRALIKRLKEFDIARIVFEATGAYHRLLQQALVEAGLPWVKVNPRQARRFAQATGKLAKTDRCDALMLARMGAALDLEPGAPVSKTVEAMKELVNARDALVKDRVAALNRQAIVVSPLIKRQLAQRLRQINGQIEAIDKHLKMLRNADSDLCQRFDILTSIPGLARISHSVIGERVWLARDDGVAWARSGERRLGENASARPPSLRVDGAASRYVDCALSGSSGRGRREPGVGDFVFALIGEG